MANSPFLTARWLDLVMLNYRVAPALLESLVPAGTLLDRWDDAVLLSVVGFRFVDTRVLGLTIPGHRDFEEVNLRFYVRRPMPEGDRRGVVFIRELVPRRSIAWLARLRYNEPYRARPMRHVITRTDERAALSYQWRQGGSWAGMSVETVGPAAPLLAGSEAEFVTEHYWGYTRQRDGGTIEYQVTHPRWRVWDAQRAHLHGDMAACYGRVLGEVLAEPLRSAFVAEGSAVSVLAPHRIG